MCHIKEESQRGQSLFIQSCADTKKPLSTSFAGCHTAIQADQSAHYCCRRLLIVSLMSPAVHRRPGPGGGRHAAQLHGACSDNLRHPRSHHPVCQADLRGHAGGRVSAGQDKQTCGSYWDLTRTQGEPVSSGRIVVFFLGTIYNPKYFWCYKSWENKSMCRCIQTDTGQLPNVKATLAMRLQRLKMNLMQNI